MCGGGVEHKAPFPHLPTRNTMHQTCSVWIFFVGMVGVLGGAWPLAASPIAVQPADPASPFTVRFGNHTISASVMAVTVMPGDTVPVSVEGRDASSSYRIEAPTNTTTWTPGDTPWSFTAPDAPGLYPLVVHGADDASVQLQVFVLEPWDHDGTYLDGYRIGRYESEPRRGLETYERPEGFIRVTKETRTTQVAPHFRLEQFLCKQTDGLPQFVLLDTHLLQLLEDVLATMRERGHSVPTLHIMSGFRTPHYNRSIGNTTVYSRHLYGDAADIFVDATGNARMDDLTDTGRVTEADAELLADIVEAVKDANGDAYVGGMGVYGPAPHRGPFVHVDLRGQRARW